MGRQDENPIPGLPNPHGKSVEELDAERRAKAYRYHKIAGTLPVFYRYWGGAPDGYFENLERQEIRDRGGKDASIERKPRGRGGR